jgi:ABC-type nitrate/sulfonate/bicarbonate transport system permease component
MSNYWHLNIIAPSPLRGGDETYIGGLLAITYHTFISLYRLVLGLVFGFLGGVFVGLVISSVEFFNKILSLTINIIRICPLLAMTPLFQFWFGTNEIGVIVFIAYGVGVIFLVGTLNAVKNIPNYYINYSKMLGASGYATLVKVVLPSILPELFSSIYLALGVAWSALISAEYIGVESGLGRIIIWSDYFTHTARMTLAALVILSLSFISILVVGRISAFALRWMPGVKSQEAA